MAHRVDKNHPPAPPPLERRQSHQQEILPVRLFNATVEKMKLEKGYIKLSEKDLKEKLEELTKRISDLSSKLKPGQLAFVNEQIQGLKEDDLKE